MVRDKESKKFISDPNPNSGYGDDEALSLCRLIQERKHI